MSSICDNCGKGIVVGRSSKHGRGVAGKRWKKRAQKTVKIFRPNLQTASFVINGKKTAMKLCMDCMGLFKKKYRAASTFVAPLVQ